MTKAITARRIGRGGGGAGGGRLRRGRRSSYRNEIGQVIWLAYLRLQGGTQLGAFRPTKAELSKSRAR